MLDTVNNLHLLAEIVTDRTAGAAIGSQVEISNHPFTVVGHTRHATVLAGLPLVYVSLREAQDTVFSNKDIVSGFLLRGHVGSVASVVFSPDGRTLASGSRDSTIKLWPLSIEDSSVTNWSVQASVDEARYGFKLEAISLVPYTPPAPKAMQ